MCFCFSFFSICHVLRIMSTRRKLSRVKCKWIPEKFERKAISRIPLEESDRETASFFRDFRFNQSQRCSVGRSSFESNSFLAADERPTFKFNHRLNCKVAASARGRFQLSCLSLSFCHLQGERIRGLKSEPQRKRERERDEAPSRNFSCAVKSYVTMFIIT